MKLPIPARISVLYVILGVLVLLSVVSMYFYSTKVEAINRDRLKTNEMILQNTVTRSLDGPRRSWLCPKRCEGR